MKVFLGIIRVLNPDFAWCALIPDSPTVLSMKAKGMNSVNAHYLKSFKLINLSTLVAISTLMIFLEKKAYSQKPYISGVPAFLV